ncbi:MAG TPA: flagellar hook-basal body complex protein FliE [Terracidiphilus sp.]|jgi:flagellar hook-basal body complex protein FliE|nr:flagellar hook-basal body complex protein FliE [Terracidiphilus sp.]
MSIAVNSAVSSALNSMDPSLAGAAGAHAANGPQTPGTAAPFSDLFTDAVGQVNQLDTQARAAVDDLMTGTDVDVHQAMIATEKSDMAFEFALAVRNKAVQAYQTVIGMQF